MTALHEHARSMLAYTIWADARLLAAAEGIDDARYAEIAAPLTHMLAIQRYWYANWSAARCVRRVARSPGYVRRSRDRCRVAPQRGPVEALTRRHDDAARSAEHR